MYPVTLRIATRKSALAIWQAEYVAKRLRCNHPSLQIELIRMITRGDEIINNSLSKIGGKGLFVKELEKGLIEGRADLAVHSMKDVPADFPAGLCLQAILPREDPRDVFISKYYTSPDDLPIGALVGTSSLRRKCQIAVQYPRWNIRNLRGNINSRLEKLDNDKYDAIILAAAGLRRLGLDSRITKVLEPELILPAVGQGAIGIECRIDDTDIRALISELDDQSTHLQVAAERAFNARLQGNCQVPIAGYAVSEGGILWLRGLVGEPDGSVIIAGEIRGPVDAGKELGLLLADELIQHGAERILCCR
jgi:hydroxymethylbilane synthase